jgi:hypothetical protein
LHTRFNVKDHPLFFNQANQTSVYFSYIRHQPCSEVHKQKIREKLLNQPISEERKSRISQTLQTYWSTAKATRKLSLQARQKISQKLRNKPLSESHKRAMRKGIREHYQVAENREKARARNQSTIALQVVCPWCEKSGSKPAMVRWHFSNCPKNPSSDSELRLNVVNSIKERNQNYWKRTPLLWKKGPWAKHAPLAF